MRGPPADFAPEEGEAATAREPWPDESPAERIVRIGAVLNKRVEVMLRRLEAGHPIEGRQVTALSNLVDLSERIAVMARQEIEEHKKQDDAELAETFRKIDSRIQYFAEHVACWLLVQKFGIPREEVRAKVPVPVEGEPWQWPERVEPWCPDDPSGEAERDGETEGSAVWPVLP